MVKINEALYHKLIDMYGADAFEDDTSTTVIVGSGEGDYVVYLVQNNDWDYIVCYTYNVSRAKKLDPSDPNYCSKERKCIANSKRLKTEKSVLNYLDKYL